MKWKCTSMCLVRAWYVESLDSAMAPWLSQKIVVGPLRSAESSERSLRSHMASFAACVRPTYSDSVLERVMMGCFFELQDIAPLPIKKAYPEIEWRWSCEAQSASVKPVKTSPSPPRTNIRSRVPFRY